MKIKCLGIIFLFIFGHDAFGQVDNIRNQEASPKSGLNELVVKYFGIEFNDIQRKKLDNKELEFFYIIDTLGNAKLSEVNGIDDAAIIDSFKFKTNELEPFNPKFENGVPTSSIYSIRFSYPTYEYSQYTYYYQNQYYREAKLEDFEMIKESGKRLDVGISFFGNQFMGNPSKYLSLGGGMRVDFYYFPNKKLFFGIMMAFGENGKEKNYPVLGTTKYRNPVTGFIGVFYGRKLNNFLVQGEISYVNQGFSRNNNLDNIEIDNFGGWSPAIYLFRPITLGQDKTLNYYGSPSLFNHLLTVHLGLRYLDLSIKEGSGLMLELGVGYRFVFKSVSEYKLKSDFLERR